MHVFHIKGLSSILLLLLAIVGAALILLALPASFMMVLWNATVFEAAHGPEIDLYQGFLLWGMVLVALKLILKPEIQLEFVKAPNSKTKSSQPKAEDAVQAENALATQDEAAALETPTVEK